MTIHASKSIITVLSVPGSIWLLAFPSLADDKKPLLTPDREQIVQRIQEIRPTAKELRFDAIGWASGIRAAEKLAKDSGRPVFLFSNVGEMDLGRC